jgi:hypothetical protein
LRQVAFARSIVRTQFMAKRKDTED